MTRLVVLMTYWVWIFQNTSRWLSILQWRDMKFLQIGIFVCLFLFCCETYWPLNVNHNRISPKYFINLIEFTANEKCLTSQRSVPKTLQSDILIWRKYHFKWNEHKMKQTFQAAAISRHQRVRGTVESRRLKPDMANTTNNKTTESRIKDGIYR